MRPFNILFFNQREAQVTYLMSEKDDFAPETLMIKNQIVNIPNPYLSLLISMLPKSLCVKVGPLK